MKFSAVLTKKQAEEMLVYLGDLFTEVRLLDIEAVKHLEKNSLSLRAFWEKCQKTRLEYIDSRVCQKISRYVEIDGQPHVVEILNVLDVTTESFENVREQLTAKVRGYDEELYLDALTGAYNRRYYENRIRKVRGHAGVAMIDLDDFKLYNDTCGHNAGDFVLNTVVGSIRGCICKTDILIRYGGDEFLLILQDVDEEIFSKKLKQIRDMVCEAEVPGYARLRLTVSIGGVLADNETIESAVARADGLMYQAKNRKNMIVTEKSGIDSAEAKERQQILIVDDSQINCEILAEILKDEYRILEAANGEECINLLKQYGTGIALLLLDINMPVMDGFEVLALMNRKHWIEDIPVIIISSENSASYVRRAYEMGASDYISRPFDVQVVHQRVSNTIKLYAKQRRLISLVTDQIREKEKNNQMMISILSQIVEFRNSESGSHVLHINIITGMLLERLMQKTDQYHLQWSDQFLITTASALHDIGKIGIDEKILNKPGKLTKEEFEIMKTHTLIGASMLKSIEMYQNEKLLQVAYQICRWHHERYDGKGYPDGLKGEEIPISAQVVAIADVYDALVGKRVYKKAFSHETAIHMILNGECGAFNPLLLECLTDIQNRLKEETKSGFNKKENEGFFPNLSEEIKEETKK
ncbi:MAG: diguanylate cyclase [Lachnospiraceae bacterium]|nr:MAG: diguanylate cyclase [Lachnospiraceae bacterium]